MRLLAVLRFRDEAMRLPGYFASIAPEVDGIVALDHGSADGSAELARCEPKVVELLREDRGSPLDEAGQRRALTLAGVRAGADWLVAVDADERLERRAGDRIRARIAADAGGKGDAYSLPIRELWDHPDAFRADGIWGQKARTTLFLAREDHRFDPRPLHGQWASTDGPPIGRHAGIDARIYHLGSLTQDGRAARQARYRELDPEGRWQRIGYEYLTDERGLRLQRIEPGREYEEVISAQVWGSEAPPNTLEDRGEPERLILHHTAIHDPQLEGGDANAEASYMRRIERLHLDRGWGGIGYHFVVMPSGRVYEGRPLWATGAHAKGHNRDSVGIAFAGNFEVEGPQPGAIRALETMQRRFARPERPLPLSCHGDLMPTACPGRLLREVLGDCGARGAAAVS